MANPSKMCTKSAQLKKFPLTIQQKTTAFLSQNNGVESLKQRRSFSLYPKTMTAMTMTVMTVGYLLFFSHQERVLFVKSNNLNINNY